MSAQPQLHTSHNAATHRHDRCFVHVIVVQHALAALHASRQVVPVGFFRVPLLLRPAVNLERKNTQSDVSHEALCSSETSTRMLHAQQWR